MARVKFVRDKEALIKALPDSFQVKDGTIYMATDTGTMWLGTGSSSLIQIKDNIDENTTYELTKTDKVIALSGSDGSKFDFSLELATVAADGLMAAEDKAKLEGIESGAQANQPAFAKVVADTTEFKAADKQDSLTIAAGNGISVTGDAVSKTVTIASTLPTMEATTSNAGYMSAADKTKLDGIAKGANKTVVDSVMSTSSTNPVQNKVVTASLAEKVSKSGDTITGTLTMSADKESKPLQVSNITGTLGEDGSYSDLYLQYGTDQAVKFGFEGDYEISNDGATYSGTAAHASEVNWANVSDKPSTYPAAAHTHDDRYYTESEVDSKLSNLSWDSFKTNVPSDKIEKVNAFALSGTIDKSVLPSTVFEVHSYSTKSGFPSVGVASNLYIDESTEKLYRYDAAQGEYNVVSDTLALGESSTTAYRGDRGKTAYDHAAAKGVKIASGLYKITTNDQGHVTAATAVTAEDITSLGIPALSHEHKASDITGGTLDIDRIPVVDSKITSVDASKIVGVLDSSNLPSYVDDVLEYDSYDVLPEEGESGKIYVTTDTNKTYRWGGTTYAPLSSGVVLGTTHDTAGYGDYTQTAYNHSQTTSGNPHNVTKSDIGLSDVENKSSETIRGEITKDNVISALGYTPSSDTDVAKDVTWGTVTDKPFETLGDGLSVADGVLSAECGTSVNSIAPLTVKYAPTASGTNAVAIGNYCEAAGNESVSIGAAAQANKANAVAIGCGAQAYEQSVSINGFAGSTRSIAIGKSSAASKDYCVAIGATAQCTNAYSACLGYGTGTNRNYEVSVGYGDYDSDDEVTRYLAHVKTPEHGTDAANKSYVDSAVSTKADADHTHLYAGSSSAGGSANSAVKLDSSAGSATNPVYFSDGKPVKTTYTLAKSVPSTAVFTDTHYTSKNIVGATTTAVSNTTSALTNGNVYLNNVENSAVTSSHKISGSGATTVTTDASGNITISSTDTNTVYTHPTTSGNKHIPSGGSSGQVLKWSADGTAAWGTDNNTTYSAGTGISLSGTTFSNSGVRAVSTGTSNGTISVNTNGTTADVSVKGLGSAAYTASTAYAAASHTHSYVPLSGGTITGSISRAGGGSWIKGRENATVKGTSTNSSSFNVVASQKTPSGSWNIGNLGSEESLSFSYDTDTDYNANTNNAVVIKLPTTKGGTLALTSDIKTYSAGTGLSLSGTTFSNSGVRSISTGSSNGTISVNTGGTTANVSVKGLGSAAYTASTAYAAASHTHSYLPLSGGTVTGATCFEGGTRVKAFEGTSGTAGYVLVATISITKAYQNSPIELTFSHRGGSTPTRLSIGFSSVNSTNPALNVFDAFGTTNEAWLYKSATSTWQLYIRKADAYDCIDVLSLLCPSYDSGISITWGSGQISTMYTSNVTQAKFGYVVGTALVADKAVYALTADSATTANSVKTEYSVVASTTEPTSSATKIWIVLDEGGETQ